MMEFRARTELGGLPRWTTMAMELLQLLLEASAPETDAESEVEEDSRGKEALFPRGRTLCCCLLLLPELLTVTDGCWSCSGTKRSPNPFILVFKHRHGAAD